MVRSGIIAALLLATMALSAGRSAWAEAPQPAAAPAPSDFAVDRSNTGSGFASDYSIVNPGTATNGLWGNMMEMMQMQEWYMRRTWTNAPGRVPYAFPNIPGQPIASTSSGFTPRIGNAVPTFATGSFPSINSPLTPILGPRVPVAGGPPGPGLPVPGGNPNRPAGGIPFPGLNPNAPAGGISVPGFNPNAPIGGLPVPGGNPNR